MAERTTRVKFELVYQCIVDYRYDNQEYGNLNNPGLIADIIDWVTDDDPREYADDRDPAIRIVAMEALPESHEIDRLKEVLAIVTDQFEEAKRQFKERMRELRREIKQKEGK